MFWNRKKKTKEENIQQLKRDVEKMIKVIKIDIEQYNMSSALRDIEYVMEVCGKIKDKWETQDCKIVFDHLSNYMVFIELTKEMDPILSKRLSYLKQYLDSVE